MPVAFLRPFGQGGFAPVARPRFILGSDLDCDLVDTAEGVAEQHATIRLQRGEYVLVAEEGCSLWVAGERVPLISLRDGDTVQLAPRASPWRFRSRVEGTFWPPNISIGEAWLAHPEYEKVANGPQRFGDGRPMTGRNPTRSRIVLGPHCPLIIKHLGPVGEPKEATHFLRLLAALGGAPHPALAAVVDGGIAPHDSEASRWMATRFVDGVCARDLIELGPLDARRVTRILRSLAEGLARLHHRGIVHRGISPRNIVVPPTQLAVLIDYSTAHSLESPLPLTGRRAALEAYAAPEVLAEESGALEPPADVYALAAVGRALLAGVSSAEPDPPAADTDTDTDTTDGDARAALEALLVPALIPNPAGRPTAAALASDLLAAEDKFSARSRS